MFGIFFDAQTTHGGSRWAALQQAWQGDWHYLRRLADFSGSNFAIPISLSEPSLNPSRHGKGISQFGCEGK